MTNPKYRGRPPNSDIEYLEQDCGYTTPCWVWQRSTVVGYGCLRIDNKTYYAHRTYYEHFVGPIPAGLDLDHLCRNRACVNPDHLEAVTRAENLRRGDRTVLTEDGVREIRRRYAEGGVYQRELAEEYGVSPVTIHSVIARKSWKDIE
jgi:hypothetical protein